MSPVVRATVIWMPRLLGIAMALFLSLFALDAFTAPASGPVFLDVLVHLAPAAIVGVAVAAAWRAPMLGAALFALMAGGYAASVPDRPDWIAAISGPLAALAVLSALSAIVRRRSSRG